MPAIIPSRNSLSRKSHVRQFSRNSVGRGNLVAVTGSTWLLQILCGCYGVYMAVTGSMWLLQILCGCYGVYVAITVSTWLLPGLCGCYGFYAVTGSMWSVMDSTWLLRVYGLFRVSPCLAHYTGLHDGVTVRAGPVVLSTLEEKNRANNSLHLLKKFHSLKCFSLDSNSRSEHLLLSEWNLVRSLDIHHWGVTSVTKRVKIQ